MNYEFYEVLNAFPILSSFFEKELKLSLNKVVEGDSVDEFFNKCDLTSFEKNVVLRKVNQKLKAFFSTDSKLNSSECEELVEEEYVDAEEE